MAKNIATTKTIALELPPFNEVAFQLPKYVNVTLETQIDVHISCWGRRTTCVKYIQTLHVIVSNKVSFSGS